MVLSLRPHPTGSPRTKDNKMESYAGKMVSQGATGGFLCIVTPEAAAASCHEALWG